MSAILTIIGWGTFAWFFIVLPICDGVQQSRLRGRYEAGDPRVQLEAPR